MRVAVVIAMGSVVVLPSDEQLSRRALSDYGSSSRLAISAARLATLPRVPRIVLGATSASLGSNSRN